MIQSQPNFTLSIVFTKYEMSCVEITLWISVVAWLHKVIIPFYLMSTWYKNHQTNQPTNWPTDRIYRPIDQETERLSDYRNGKIVTARLRFDFGPLPLPIHVAAKLISSTISNICVKCQRNHSQLWFAFFWVNSSHSALAVPLEKENATIASIRSNEFCRNCTYKR